MVFKQTFPYSRKENLISTYFKSKLFFIQIYSKLKIICYWLIGKINDYGNSYWREKTIHTEAGSNDSMVGTGGQ